MKIELPEPLVSGELARLLPVVKDTSSEDRASSILLATFRAVPEFCQIMLNGIGQKIGSKSKISCYSQVRMALPKDSKIRPDGFIRVERAGRIWTAIIEAKIGNALLDKEQIIQYADLARQNNIDAIITISNDFTALPTHHPIIFSGREIKGIQIFHWSWLNTVTHAQLVQLNDAALSPTKKIILDEFLRYFEHDSVGVKGFTQMNPEWKNVVQQITNGAILKKTSEDILNTVSAWHQESRDLCLILSRELGVAIKERLIRKHINDSVLRLKDDAETLVNTRTLTCILNIPDTASVLYVTAHLSRRSISCSMRLAATQEKKTTKAQVNWLIRQLKKSNTEFIHIRAWRKKSSHPEQKTLIEIRENPSCLIAEGKEKILFARFEVAIIRDLAVKFSGSKNFIKNLEEITALFYAEVGQHLRSWVKPAPKAPLDENETDNNIT